MQFRYIALALGAAAAMSGCAVTAPPYSASINNVSTLKSSGTTPLAVGGFTVKSGIDGGKSISLRGNTMTSAIGADYAAYLAEALRGELDMARRLDPKSNIEITGVLLRNDVDASGLSKGTGALEAQFIVRREGQVRFDKVKRTSAEWESSFAGAIAIPKAAQNYPVMVQDLLASLYRDTDFQTALR